MSFGSLMRRTESSSTKTLDERVKELEEVVFKIGDALNETRDELQVLVDERGGIIELHVSRFENKLTPEQKLQAEKDASDFVKTHKKLQQGKEEWKKKQRVAFLQESP